MSEPDIHGIGRCTCAGEGRCAWCQELCDRCWGDAMDPPCFACNGTGYADGRSLSMEERAAKIEAIRGELVDYEALGYPETEITEAVCGVEELAVSVDLFLGTLMGDTHERVEAYRARVIQKDIRGDTNRVDDNASDSYK